MDILPDVYIGETKLSLGYVRQELLGDLTDDIGGIFKFFTFNYSDKQFVLLVPTSERKFSPTGYLNIAKRVAKVFEKPAVFLFKKLYFHERERLKNLRCLSIVSRKYAELYISQTIPSWIDEIDNAYTPLYYAGHYIATYHLLVNNIKDVPIAELKGLTPYAPSILLQAIQQMALCRLCEYPYKISDRVFFYGKPKTVWKSVKSWFRTPIIKTLYCNSINKNGCLYISGNRAVTHYTGIEQSNILSFAIEYLDFKKHLHLFDGLNDKEGAVKIEIWGYKPLSSDGFVDICSLYFTLANDNPTKLKLDEIINNSLG